MTEWLHQIPVTGFFPLDIDDQREISSACLAIHRTLIEHRAFLRYVEVSEEEIEEYTDITDDFQHVTAFNEIVIYPNAEEFDEAMERLYDWADKNRIWID